MKTIKLLIAILVTSPLFGLSFKPHFYQVISSHPEDVEQVYELTKTEYQNGRLWIVSLRDGVKANQYSEFLRPVTGDEVTYVYHAQKKSHNNSDETVLKKISEINSVNLKSDVEFLANFKTRAAGTLENQTAIEDVSKRLADYGYTIIKECYRASACSVIARKAGAVSTDKTLMLMGHIDSVGQDFAGADDNATGTAVLLEIARVYASHENKKNIEFFITNGEELGLLGAKDYVKKIISANRKHEFSLVINMDMVGYNSNGIVELETNKKFENLARWFGELTEQYTSLKSKITLNAWGSDHVPFLDNGIPAILTIEDWSTKTPCYHRACDKPDTINYNYMHEITKLNLAALLIEDAAR